MWVRLTSLRFLSVLAIVASAPIPTQAAADVWLVYVSHDNYRGGVWRVGETMNIQYRIDNVGDEDSGPFTVDLYLSTDTSFTSNDCHVDSGQVQNSSPGIGEIFSVKYVVRSLLPDGQYYLGGIVNCPSDTNGANDTDYDNRPVRITSTPPDVAVQQVSVPDRPYHRGDQLVVTTEVENVGGRLSDSYSISISTGTSRDRRQTPIR
jgi:hypothetical protein